MCRGENAEPRQLAGMYFYGEKGGHIVHGNRFEKTLTQITVSGPTTARDHDWRGNYWDDYQGFDRDGDGFGDTPYEQYAYADRIWMDFPKARFFLNAPVLESHRLPGASCSLFGPGAYPARSVAALSAR